MVLPEKVLVSKQFIFFTGILLGVWVSISRAGWVGAWIGIELNLLCFLPFLIYNSKSEARVGLLYFFAQAAGSSFIIFWGSYPREDLFISCAVRFALLIKVGASPYHIWYVWISERVQWSQFLVLRRVQKLTPVVLLRIHFNQIRHESLFLRVVFCGVVGAFGGYQAVSLRSLLAYSSISHLGWILLIVKEGRQYWVKYLIIYWLILWLIVSVIGRSRIFHLRQLNKGNFSLRFKVVFVVAIFTLRGLPPFSGFVIKLGVVMVVSSTTSIVCLYLIIITRVVNLFYYLQTRLRILLLRSRKKVHTPLFKDRRILILAVLSSLVVVFSPLILPNY